MRIRKIFQAIGNSLLAILQGKFLLRLGVDNYFPHIIYTCFLLWAAIWIGMKAEGAMAIVEKNKKTVNELRIEHIQTTVKMTNLNSIGKVEEMLSERGSQLQYPKEPAKRIGK